MTAIAEAGQADAPTSRRRHPAIGWAGLALVGTMAVLALIAPLIRPFRPTAFSGGALEPPSWQHLLGTNRLGQDLASQMLEGCRSSLLIAAVAGGGTLLLGSSVGVLAAWWGGWTDHLLMRVVDVFLATPRLPLLVVVGLYAGGDLIVVAAVIALVFWPGPARAVRAQVLSLRRRPYLKAAIGFGAGTWHVIRRHVVPEIGLILVAQLLAAMGRAILLEAGLAFLGIGDPSRLSWGTIMQSARSAPGLYYTSAWLWWMLPPLVAIVALLLGMTFLGIAVEQRINPRLVRHAGVR